MNKRSGQILILVLLLAFVLWLFFTFINVDRSGSTSSHSSAPAGNYEPKFKKEGELYFLNAALGDTIRSIDIEVAETREEISYGMMYRKSMDPNTGMLFLMGEERNQSFYMKNTYVPLDIIYINRQLEVVSIQKNAEPLNERSLPSEGPAAYVLEVSAGFSDQYGITKGTRILYRR